MTVIKPNKNKSRWNSIIFFCAVGAIFCVALNVFFYARSVAYRQESRKAEARLENLRLRNAELKNRIFNLTDLNSMKDFAEKNGLIKDGNPRWEIAASF
jgi:cell division protein FtsL